MPDNSSAAVTTGASPQGDAPVAVWCDTCGQGYVMALAGALLNKRTYGYCPQCGSATLTDRTTGWPLALRELDLTQGSRLLLYKRWRRAMHAAHYQSFDDYVTDVASGQVDPRQP